MEESERRLPDIVTAELRDSEGEFRPTDTMDMYSFPTKAVISYN